MKIKYSNKYRTIWLAAYVSAAVALWSCSSGNDSSSSETLFSINPTLSEFTDAGSSSSSFISGDALGIYVIPTVTSNSSSTSTTTQISNRQYSYDGSLWATSETSVWPDGKDDTACKVYAYAPYNSNATMSSQIFSCPTDQSTLEKMHKADFIYGTATTTKSNTAVPINMSHLFSVVTINIKYGTSIGDIVAGASTTALNQATVNLYNGNMVTIGNSTAITMAKLASAPSGYSKSYSCIVPVQSLSGNNLMLTFSDGTTKSFEFKQTLEKNMHYSVNISVIGNKEIVVNSISVAAWDESVTVTGGIVSKVSNYNTGDVITYMKNRETNPVTIVVIPEGFTQSQLSYGGLFEQKARAAMDFFFSVEPYKSYKDYFNVYFLAAVSNEQGADSLATDAAHPAHLHDTYFGAGWEWDGHYTMTADADKIFSFVTQYCPDIVKGKTTVDNVAILMIINDARYGGITWTYSSGRAFAMCPLTAGSLRWAGKDPATTGYSTGDWRNTLIHEGGGHCFGKLLDEYYGTATYTSTTISGHSWTVPFGLNITADISATSTTYFWKDMIGTGIGKFSKEGAWEGGYASYAKGVWRPENISIMIDNRRYFNAWSRYLIAKRIVHDLGGGSFTYNDFLAKDVNYDEILDNSSSVAHEAAFTQGIGEKVYPPLPPPVMHQ